VAEVASQAKALASAPPGEQHPEALDPLGEQGRAQGLGPAVAGGVTVIGEQHPLGFVRAQGR
jgi:hypothetical protein